MKNMFKDAKARHKLEDIRSIAGSGIRSCSYLKIAGQDKTWGNEYFRIIGYTEMY